MKWMGAKKVEEVYQLMKPSYNAIKRTNLSFFVRKANETNSSTMCEDLVAWLLVEGVVSIDLERVGSLCLKNVHLSNGD